MHTIWNNFEQYGLNVPVSGASAMLVTALFIFLAQNEGR